MLRVLVLLLLVGNLAFWAWSKGWLAPVAPPPRQGEREPERLNNQVRPEAVLVLSPTAATAATAAANAAATAAPAASEPASPAPLPAAAPAVAPAVTPAAVAAAGGQCLEAGPFAPTEATAATAALAQVGLPAGSWSRVEGAAPVAPWMVYAGRFADAAARKTRQQGWEKAGLKTQAIDSPPELSPGLSLARHSSRESAEAALAGLSAEVRQVARVVNLPAAAFLRAPAADAALAARLLALPAPWQGSFKPCVVR
jgi:hypothetical protein